MRVYHRNTAIFAGIFTLAQGCVWAFLAVWSVGIYSCTFNYPSLSPGENTVGNLFFYSYEQGTCRSSSTKDLLPGPHRTYAIMLTYGILSAAWIPTSILVLVAAVNKIHGKKGARCYYPWLFITAAVLVLDIIGITFYSIDVSKTMTAKDYLLHYPHVSPSQVRGMDGLTVVPALLMVIFCCRAVVIWLINAVVFGVIIQAVIDLKKPSPAAEFVEKEARMRPPENRRPGAWVNVENRRGLEMSPQRPPLRWDDRRPDETIIQSPTEERDRPAYPGQSALRRTEGQPPFPVQRPTRLQLAPQGRLPPSPPPDPSTPIFDVTGKPTTPDSPQPVITRTSTSQYLQGIDNTMPFSYTHPRPIPPPPPKSIPEPDYTLHRVPIRPSIYSSTSTPPEEEEIRPTKRYENNPNVWKVM